MTDPTAGLPASDPASEAPAAEGPTAEEIRLRMAEVLGVAEPRMRPEAELAELVSDSYRLVEMAIELQDDYDVILSQADLNKVTTVSDLVDVIRSRSGR